MIFDLTGPGQEIIVPEVVVDGRVAGVGAAVVVGADTQSVVVSIFSQFPLRTR